MTGWLHLQPLVLPRHWQSVGRPKSSSEYSLNTMHSPYEILEMIRRRPESVFHGRSRQLRNERRNDPPVRHVSTNKQRISRVNLSCD